MKTYAETPTGRIAVETVTPTRERCQQCQWWKDDDGRCVNRWCGEFQHSQDDDGEQ